MKEKIKILLKDKVIISSAFLYLILHVTIIYTQIESGGQKDLLTGIFVFTKAYFAGLLVYILGEIFVNTIILKKSITWL